MQVAKMLPVRKGSHPGKLLDPSPATSISLSKLADESQLGSLSKLLTPAHNNNVNDCSYENWQTDVHVDPIRNSCTPQYETTLQYKSFMPLKKRFRQDFVNEIVKKESPEVFPQPTINHQPVEIETRNLIRNITPVINDCIPVAPIEQPSFQPPPVPIKKLATVVKRTDETKQSRATKFRACKGERYKMFMNSSRKTRSKSGRWDLRQKALPPPDKPSLDGELELQQRINNDLSNLEMEEFNNKPEVRHKRPKRIRAKRKRRQLSPTKSNITFLENFENNINDNGVMIDGDKKLTKDEVVEVKVEFKEEEDDEEEVEDEDDDDNVQNHHHHQSNINDLLNNKENGLIADNEDNLKADPDLKPSDINADNYETKTGTTVVGSRKRKLRKQNIMRLQPGSTFKDMRVVEDSLVCDLGTLAEVAVSSEQKTSRQNLKS